MDRLDTVVSSGLESFVKKINKVFLLKTSTKLCTGNVEHVPLQNWGIGVIGYAGVFATKYKTKAYYIIFL